MQNSKPKAIDADSLVAHRGYQQHFPENTLLAIAEALALGALHVELDVQLSADRVPMIYHDDSLERMSGRSGLLKDFSAAQLQQMPAHEPQRFGQRFADERIATLAQLLPLVRAHPSATFYVELKEEAVRDHGIGPCLRQIHQVLEPVLAQCVLISFDEAALAQASQFPRIGLVTRRWADREQQIAALGCSVLFVNHQRIPAGDSATASCPVVVYEIGQPQEARHWLARGASKVETFAFGEMLGVAL